MIRPARLAAGARISVVAPSGPVPRDRFLTGAEKLSKRYSLVYDADRLFAASGYLAGADRSRADELRAALQDPSTDAVWVARGGYGLMRVLAALDAKDFARPKVLVGFSDVTALHGYAACVGMTSIHGPVVTQLSELGQIDVDGVCDLLAGATPKWSALRTLIGSGVVEGRTAGGNIEVLSRLCGTPWQWPLDDTILFLEEIGERPYRIDRALTQLRLAGAFAKVRAVVVGDLTSCGDDKYPSPNAEEVLLEHFGALDIPVVLGAMFGHGLRNRAFPLGTQARLDLSHGELSFGEAVVA